MDLEHHQIELRYEALRQRDPHREAQLLASLAGRGQICPVVVLPAAAEGTYVLLDGYKRMRAFRQLKRDTAQAMVWPLDETEALLLERLMRTSRKESPFEQGWLLRELRDRFDMSMGELGRRFDRTTGWVSRRLALVQDLPEAIQDQVRLGRIAPDTAMKILVPLSRVNHTDAQKFSSAVAQARLSTREALALYLGWLRGDDQVRERILKNPRLFMRARGSEPGALDSDLKTLSAIARRALGKAGEEAMALVPARTFRQAQADCEALFTRLGTEFTHA
jgi:ParB family transcriptional regulator, chromosome partitioning protein